VSRLCYTAVSSESRSGRGFLLHLGVCVDGCRLRRLRLHYFQPERFMEHKSDEKVIALRLVDAFVTIIRRYGRNRPERPVPASFRAMHRSLQQARRRQFRFPAALVGPPGRQILTAPSDARMADSIEAFATTARSKACPNCSTTTANRCSAVYPAWRRNRAASLHNALQPDKPNGTHDVIGAVVIDGRCRLSCAR